LSDPKLVVKDRPAKAQIVLGWTLNMRSLLVILPFDKFEAWSRDLKAIIADRKGTFEQLKTMIGRLNHAACIIPLSQRLRLQVRKHKKQLRSLNQAKIDDFDLWVSFLSQAQAGSSMNQMTIQWPSKICWLDSCPFGIGRFPLSGQAWTLRMSQAPSAMESTQRMTSLSS
jgi:hypothetical protein